VQDESHRFGQLARVVADGRRAQWEKTCEEQDALMARRAAHNPYVEDAVLAAIPSVLSKPARIVSERKRANDMRLVLEKIQATGGLPRSGVMGNHCDMRDSDDVVKDVPSQPTVLAQSAGASTSSSTSLTASSSSALTLPCSTMAATAPTLMATRVIGMARLGLSARSPLSDIICGGIGCARKIDLDTYQSESNRKLSLSL
jgi:hypothetical protein